MILLLKSKILEKGVITTTRPPQLHHCYVIILHQKTVFHVFDNFLIKSLNDFWTAWEISGGTMYVIKTFSRTLLFHYMRFVRITRIQINSRYKPGESFCLTKKTAIDMIP